MPDNKTKIKKIFNLLNLNKPLVIFDLEATGPSISSDRIIQIAYVKMWPNGRVVEDNLFLNPEIEMAPEVKMLLGLENEDLAAKPSFKEKRREIWNIFHGCYFAGFNIINFDLPLLRREFIRLGVDFEYDNSLIIDSKIIYKFFTPQNLSNIYEHYCKKNIMLERGAVNDVNTTMDLLLAQIKKHNDIKDAGFIGNINKFCVENESIDACVIASNNRKFYWKNGEPHFAFSKHKHKPILQVAKEDPAFIEWMLEANYSEQIKEIIKNILKKAKKNK